MKISTELPTDLSAPQAPPRANGQDWPFLLLHGSQATFADTVTELIGEIIQGYSLIGSDLDGDDQALIARHAQAVTMAAYVQGGICADATGRGDLDVNEISEDHVNALFADRTDPFVGITDPITGELTVNWTFQVPLILVDTDYAPFTDRPCPTGRITMISPATETGYLTSLDSLGLLVFRVLDAAVRDQRANELLPQPC